MCGFFVAAFFGSNKNRSLGFRGLTDLTEFLTNNKPRYPTGANKSIAKVTFEISSRIAKGLERDVPLLHVVK